MATAREVGWFLAAAAAFERDADEFASSSERVRCRRGRRLGTIAHARAFAFSRSVPARARGDDLVVVTVCP
jgi:hypothetical protein